MEEEIIDFLLHNNYDIRISNNGRWIDQKCTPDVVCIIADCIVEFFYATSKEYFSSLDIWHNAYTINNVEKIFKKPNVDSEYTRNEYDKFFQQPMEMLANSKILLKEKQGNRNFYKINNLEILKYISMRESNSLNFLCLYIEKVLRDSEIYYLFENFFNKQDKESFFQLKNGYTNFTIINTNINTPVECGRIFTKVLNPLSYMKNKCGTQRGRISQDLITLDMIMYNRPNWKDIANNKPKGITRKEFENTNSSEQFLEYSIQKAKRILMDYNKKYRNGISEVREKGEYYNDAIHAHHIFPKNEFPSIANYIENLIALTPTQHLVYAHPNGSTSYIDIEYQYYCLVCKINSIRENLTNNEIKEKIYDFNCMIGVLNTGLKTEEFKNIKYMDFATVFRLLDFVTMKENNKKASEITMKYENK